MGGKGSKQQPPQRGGAEGTGDAYKTATGDQQQNGASSTTENDIKTTTPSPTVDVAAPTVAPAEQSPTTLSKSHPLAAYMHPAAAAAATTAPLKTVKVLKQELKTLKKSVKRTKGLSEEDKGANTAKVAALEAELSAAAAAPTPASLKKEIAALNKFAKKTRFSPEGKERHDAKVAALELQLATLTGARTAAANPGKGYVAMRRDSTEWGAKTPLSAKMEQMVETVGAMVPDTQAAAKELEDLIARVEKDSDASLTEFRVVNNGSLANLKVVDRDATFKQIGSALVKSKHVTDITITNSGGNDALAIEMAEVIKTNTTVLRLNMESNGIEEAGMLALANALAVSGLQELRLSHQKKSIATSALELFVAAVEGNKVTTVCSLGMRDKSLDYRLNRALASNLDAVRAARHASNVSAGAFKPKLTAMQLRIEALPASMETKLVLPDDVQFKQLPTKWQEEIFCEKLAASTTVAILDLAGVGLKDEFCTAFAEHVLKAGTQLREINLSRNEFSGAGITAIAEALAGTAVQKIKLNNQKKSLSADAEAAMVAASLANKNLVTINLDWRSTQHRNAAEGHLMRNQDLLRQ
eukprot:gene8751-3512_t